MKCRILKAAAVLLAALGLAWGCGFDDALREYLSAHFWLPFAKGPAAFERPGVRRISAPFAGMGPAPDASPLARLRIAYQQISQPVTEAFDPAPLREFVAAARAAASLTPGQREEIDLIDAKIDLRAGDPDRPELLRSAQKKLEAFLRAARTPAFRSEARGWLARVHYLLKDQTAAGKIYLDELNRNGSNLSRETLLNSLRLTYGYDGGPQLLAHLEEYFDTPEHAAFAIQLATNPRWNRSERRRFERAETAAEAYHRIHALLEKHRGLLRSGRGADTLALLAMRTELRGGDPAAANRIAATVPPRARIRRDPDFLWMLASSRFLSREYARAAEPLLALFRSSRGHDDRKAAAAYALCGVYRKTGNVQEQLRFALWLQSVVKERQMWLGNPSRVEDFTVYWAISGWDLNLLLDAEAPLDALRSFSERNPGLRDIRLVKYSLAVRLARENRYDEAVEIYASIGAHRRAERMTRLAALHREAEGGAPEARYRLAAFLRDNPERIYFNDALWYGLQRYALEPSGDTRMTRAERERQLALERQLKDEQDERWRAYLILREVVREAGRSETGRRAAALALRCLRGINTDRFGREEEIRNADLELSARLRRAAGPVQDPAR